MCVCVCVCVCVWVGVCVGVCVCVYRGRDINKLRKQRPSKSRMVKLITLTLILFACVPIK